MYYVYHIPKRQEWGCTNNLEHRLKQLKYTILDVDRVITVGNMNKAADMEKELNLEYGYKWSDANDYRHVTRIGGFSKEQQSKGGKTNVDSGHLKNISSFAGKIGGKAQSEKEYTCPNCNRKGRGNRFVSHIKNCK
jgi:hypothetical protein